jgi:general transcription factor 3C polypeptide 2
VFTLLLSLRFTSIVFEEVRNISLGLASRGVDWNSLGWRGAIHVFSSLLSRVLESLFVTSTAVADAVAARGYTGAAQHRLLSPGTMGGERRNDPLRFIGNASAVLLLGMFVGHFNEGALGALGNSGNVF